jgi:hypothetical protein
VALATVSASGAISAPVAVPFDFGKRTLTIHAVIGGEQVIGLLDTGVSPSAIDLGVANRRHLPVEHDAGGAASGEGDGHSPSAYPASIRGLSIAGRRFPPIEALASDMGALATAYGAPLRFVLGYSFLKRQPVLIDYTSNRLTFLDDGSQATKLTATCRQRFEQPLLLLKDIDWPVISAFRLGGASAPVSLDTGSNAGISLYQSALALAGVRSALTGGKTVEHGGFLGSAKTTAYSFAAPMGFGPFNLPAGQEVTVRKDVGSTDTRVANLGNRTLSALRLKMLLDYPGKRIVFWGACS